jgi:hypothetical protein
MDGEHLNVILQIAGGKISQSVTMTEIIQKTLGRQMKGN